MNKEERQAKALERIALENNIQKIIEKYTSNEPTKLYKGELKADIAVLIDGYKRMRQSSIYSKNNYRRMRIERDNLLFRERERNNESK